MLQTTLFAPDSSWRPPRLADLPQDWNVTTRMSLDTETKDLLLKKLGVGARRGAQVVGVSFALNKARGYYLPWHHLAGDNMEEVEAAKEYVRAQAKAYRGEVVGAKLSYDLDMLAEMGIEFPNASAFRDVQVAEPLLDENQFSYSLDSILARHGLPLKDEAMLREAAAAFGVNPKADMWKLSARYVGAYAEGDATRPLELLEVQEKLLAEQGLTPIWDLETRVLPVLVRMRRRGVRVDLDRLEKVERYARAEEMKAWGELQRLTGVAVRVGDAMKSEVIAHALKAVGIVPPLTAGAKPKPSITKDWLERLDHPAGRIIRRARKMSQLKTTFCDSVREHAIIKNGEARIHCTFNQTVMQDDDDKDPEGARPGRMSCCDPNLQQQPARDKELGPMWRAIYVADQGGLWASEDYSQQEPRLAVHFAVISGPSRIGEVAYQKACQAAQRYWDDRTTDAHTMFTQMVYGDAVTEQEDFDYIRKRMKNIFLGVCYGMGGPKLCGDLGLPTKVITDEKGRRREVAGEEGQALLNLVDARAPYLRATAKALEKVAKNRGYIRTILGRHCHFEKDRFGNYDWTHKSFNRAIQGSAADQTKYAMVELDRAGAYLQLQVHDEFDLTVESVEEAKRYAEIMETCVPLKVPSKVDVEIGPSWGEAKGIG